VSPSRGRPRVYARPFSKGVKRCGLDVSSAMVGQAVVLAQPRTTGKGQARPVADITVVIIAVHAGGPSSRLTESQALAVPRLRDPQWPAEHVLSAEVQLLLSSAGFGHVSRFVCPRSRCPRRLAGGARRVPEENSSRDCGACCTSRRIRTVHVVIETWHCGAHRTFNCHAARIPFAKSRGF
jgi:hypothetical protein